MDENQIQMAGDDVDLPEDLRKMVDEDHEEEEDKDSILGQLQNLQNMDLDTIKEKAQATITEIKQTAEQKCSVMWGAGGAAEGDQVKVEVITLLRNILSSTYSIQWAGLEKPWWQNSLQTRRQQLNKLFLVECLARTWQQKMIRSF